MCRASQWIIETPPLRHLQLDGRGLPTGETARQPAMTEPLGDKAFDDGYDEVAEGAVFAVSGGGRRIEVHFDEGYPAAQIFAPPGENVVCFEPMTAPTDALRRGGYRPRRLAVGELPSSRSVSSDAIEHVLKSARLTGTLSQSWAGGAREPWREWCIDR